MFEAVTQSAQAVQALERAILRGELEPGKPLRIQDLSRQFGIGATPLREGLSRLVSRGQVQLISNAGFRVAEISASDLDDILRVRTLVELEALEASIDQGDSKWEAGIVAALHQLRSFESKARNEAEGNQQFDDLHKSFHTSMLAACGSPRLLALHSDLYNQAFRYRMVMLNRVGNHAKVADVHVELAQMVLDRDKAAATKVLREHIQLTARLYASVTPKSGKKH